MIKLMGRESGSIAVEASLSSGDVNLCLVPEVTFQLPCIRDYVRKRLTDREHCVIVVAEGAGQHLFENISLGKDASGNTRLADVGVELRNYLAKELPDATVKVE